jgi:hypothetical protein
VSKKEIVTYGIGLFLLVLAAGMVVTLTEVKTGADIEDWTPVPLHTLPATSTPTGGWWDHKPTPPFSSQTPTQTITPTPKD